MGDLVKGLCLLALGVLALMSLVPIHLKKRSRVWWLFLPMLAIPAFFIYDALLTPAQRYSQFYLMLLAAFLFILMNTLAKWLILWYLEFKPIARSPFGAKLNGRILQVVALIPIAFILWITFYPH